MTVRRKLDDRLAEVRYEIREHQAALNDQRMMLAILQDEERTLNLRIVKPLADELALYIRGEINSCAVCHGAAICDWCQGRERILGYYEAAVADLNKMESRLESGMP